jgi:hypothetical protein
MLRVVKLLRHLALTINVLGPPAATPGEKTWQLKRQCRPGKMGNAF